ncbi:hypothetical protein ACFLU9_01220 [Chloroflexota bacterium]
MIVSATFFLFAIIAAISIGIEGHENIILDLLFAGFLGITLLFLEVAFTLWHLEDHIGAVYLLVENKTSNSSIELLRMQDSIIHRQNIDFEMILDRNLKDIRNNIRNIYKIQDEKL